MTVNEVVPDFQAIIQTNETIQLSDYRGRNVLLYFYPKNHSHGCTQEAQEFRDNYAQFVELNTVILGVSRDVVNSHVYFKNKHNLPFDLISDADETLCQSFDVIIPKTVWGKSLSGIARSSFLINAEGVLVKEWRKVKVKGHVQTVLTFLHTI